MTETIQLQIGGMTCGGCVKAVTNALARVPGVISVDVDLAGGRANVAGEAALPALLAAVTQAGFEVGPAA